MRSSYCHWQLLHKTIAWEVCKSINNSSASRFKAGSCRCTWVAVTLLKAANLFHDMLVTSGYRLVKDGIPSAWMMLAIPNIQYEGSFNSSNNQGFELCSIQLKTPWPWTIWTQLHYSWKWSPVSDFIYIKIWTVFFWHRMSYCLFLSWWPRSAARCMNPPGLH